MRFRSFDRQWIIPDERLDQSAEPEALEGYSASKFIDGAGGSTRQRLVPQSRLLSLIPDLHHYKGSRRPRISALARCAGDATEVGPNCCTLLAKTLWRGVTAEDVIAYIAAVMAHPAFTARFKADLVQPGLRASADRGRRAVRRSRRARPRSDLAA